MPILSDSQLAYIRSIKADNYPQTLDIYRAATVVGGQSSGQTLISAGASCRRWPGAKAQKIVASIPELAGVRVDELIFFPDTVSGLIRGGELRSTSGEKLKIEGLGRWQTSIAIAASLVVPK